MYAIDLLGFGASDKPPLAYSTELWRDQLLDFLQEFIDAPAVLVGNSIGSLIGLMVRAAIEVFSRYAGAKLNLRNWIPRFPHFRVWSWIQNKNPTLQPLHEHAAAVVPTANDMSRCRARVSKK